MQDDVDKSINHTCSTKKTLLYSSPSRELPSIIYWSINQKLNDMRAVAKESAEGWHSKNEEIEKIWEMMFLRVGIIPSGDQCEVAGSCLSSPCVHGSCRQKTPTEHVCQCEEGYRGDRCEVREIKDHAGGCWLRPLYLFLPHTYFTSLTCKIPWEYN